MPGQPRKLARAGAIGPAAPSGSGPTAIVFARATTAIRRKAALISGDRFLPTVLKNVAHLLSGNAVALLLGVVSMGILARALGPAGLGLIVLVESYGKMLNQLIKLETWQTFIRYGAIALEQGDRSRFLRLIKFGFALDIGLSAMSAVVCLLTASIAASLLGLSGEGVAMMQFYAIALVFGIGSTPLGILRIFDKFALIAWLDPIAAVLRLALLALAFFLGATAWTYLAIIVFVLVAQRILLSVVAYFVLRSEGYTGFLGEPLKGVAGENPGMLGMIVSSNFTILLRKSTQEVDVLAVGAFLGPAAAGIYQIARKLGYALQKAGGTLQQVSFPHLARLWARRDIEPFKKLVRQIEAMTLAGALACSVMLVFLAEPVVLLIAGRDYLDATVPLIIHSLATLALLCGSALRPALANMGLQTRILMATALSVSVFYATIVVAVPRFGIAGASIAHLVANAIMLPAIVLLYSRALRREAQDQQRSDQPVPPARPAE
ncbi:lipopolysaccharide biosynthesis protein [Qipengyuania zhejiangensis]|uniref:lipopolysaccharide biosynthesis protein n=1 Tax=Qipengyuania zhejiangensis TaxID=3077782 RepID=UPI002D77EB34|nr:oligosaccharide flippase family protein [Qipengyuania sp. Z2]